LKSAAELQLTFLGAKKNPKCQTDLATALIRGFCSMWYNPSLYKLIIGTTMHSGSLLVYCSAGPFLLADASRRKSALGFSVCSTASALDHSKEKAFESWKDNNV